MTRAELIAEYLLRETESIARQKQADIDRGPARDVAATVLIGHEEWLRCLTVAVNDLARVVSSLEGGEEVHGPAGGGE